MALPELTVNGDLPAGVHAASMEETIKRFGIGHAQRIAIGQRLERIHELAASTRALRRFVVFGSFVTDKPIPNDVDVFIVMEDDFDSSQLAGELRVLFDHAAADAHFGASVFWMRPMAMIGGEQSMVEFWQRTRDGDVRGIIEIVEV